ncbi:MAG: hypothetical protein AMXMBFR33_68270 [Candidatus Xenobia bacterium]
MAKKVLIVGGGTMGVGIIATFLAGGWRTVRLSFGFRYAAAGPITQKEHSGWDTTCESSTSIWPHLCNATGPPPVLLKQVQEGHLGFKTGRGFFPWDEASIARENARYDNALHKCLEIFRGEGII